MEGKGPPFDFNLEILPQLFNTPGTEIAPGSDIIGKDLKNLWHRHVISPLLSGVSGGEYAVSGFRFSALLHRDGEVVAVDHLIVVLVAQDLFDL